MQKTMTGLKYMENLECIKDDSIVLIHDGVRPLVDELLLLEILIW